VASTRTLLVQADLVVPGISGPELPVTDLEQQRRRYKRDGESTASLSHRNVNILVDPGREDQIRTFEVSTSAGCRVIANPNPKSFLGINFRGGTADASIDL
jgi:hypothetical protein